MKSQRTGSFSLAQYLGVARSYLVREYNIQLEKSWRKGDGCTHPLSSRERKGKDGRRKEVDQKRKKKFLFDSG